jgi:hypothetical protein
MPDMASDPPHSMPTVIASQGHGARFWDCARANILSAIRMPAVVDRTEPPVA